MTKTLHALGKTELALEIEFAYKGHAHGGPERILFDLLLVESAVIREMKRSGLMYEDVIIKSIRAI